MVEMNMFGRIMILSMQLLSNGKVEVREDRKNSRPLFKYRATRINEIWVTPLRLCIPDPKSLMHKTIHEQNNLCTDYQIKFTNKDNLM